MLEGKKVRKFEGWKVLRLEGYKVRFGNGTQRDKSLPHFMKA
jgi:hypothetical protein